MNGSLSQLPFYKQKSIFKCLKKKLNEIDAKVKREYSDFILKILYIEIKVNVIFLKLKNK